MYILWDIEYIKAIFIIKDISWDVLHITGLAQYCSSSITNALELLQSCAKSLICKFDTVPPAFTSKAITHTVCYL